ncbi:MULTISPECIES: hypothetical protein [Hyphobacterium]|uniref:Uncharacterized protein n=1 Tax=Hyphobacterium vulgare TaxID=1736751 RepID=A0ABV6ZUV1_9PROT
MPAWIRIVNFVSARIRRAVWLVLAVAALQAVTAFSERPAPAVRAALPMAENVNLLQPPLD